MRMCPECGEEYLPTVVECVHCRVPLVAPGIAPAEAPHELPPASHLVCVRTASLGWAQGLSERLSEAGISHRLQADPNARDANVRRGDAMPYGVYVREQDIAAAREVDRAFMRSQIPDLPEDGVGDVSGEGCPACGAAVAPDASECGECGLALLDA